jgi:brefeldin A-inhibited guanine nucleotide-exchange protein
MSKIREDGLALFKNICKLSMKFGTPDSPDDPMLLRGKILSLELVRMVVDNAGPFWKTNEKYVPSSILLHTISVLSYYCNES